MHGCSEECLERSTTVKRDIGTIFRTTIPESISNATMRRRTEREELAGALLLQRRQQGTLLKPPYSSQGMRALT